MALIKCFECGKEISDQSAACIGCGVPIGSTVRVDQEAQNENLSNLKKLDEELREQTRFMPRIWETEVLTESIASYIKSAMNVDSGTLFLTNRRLVFCGRIGFYTKLMAFGALALLNEGKGPKIHFQLILDDIAKIEVGRHGFAKAFVAHLKDRSTCKFQVRDYVQWAKVLNDLGLQVQTD